MENLDSHYPMITADDEELDELAIIPEQTKYNDFNIYACNSNGKKGAVIYTYSNNIAKIIDGMKACTNWATNNGDKGPYYLAKGTEACSEALDS